MAQMRTNQHRLGKTNTAVKNQNDADDEKRQLEREEAAKAEIERQRILAKLEKDAEKKRERRRKKREAGKLSKTTSCNTSRQSSVQPTPGGIHHQQRRQKEVDEELENLHTGGNQQFNQALQQRLLAAGGSLGGEDEDTTATTERAATRSLPSKSILQQNEEPPAQAVASSSRFGFLHTPFSIAKKIISVPFGGGGSGSPTAVAASSTEEPQQNFLGQHHQSRTPQVIHPTQSQSRSVVASGTHTPLARDTLDIVATVDEYTDDSWKAIIIKISDILEPKTLILRP